MNKKKNIAKADKKNNAEYEKKRVRNGLIFMLCIGMVMIAFSASMFFGYCRPFTKFEYYQCIIKNQEWFELDHYHVRVIYYVDGEKYEKILFMNRGGDGSGSRIHFYYNIDDPTDTMSANRGPLLIVFPCVAGFGMLLIAFGFLQYKQWKKRRKRIFKVEKRARQQF